MMDDASNMFDEFDPDKGQATPAPSPAAPDQSAPTQAAAPNPFDEFDPAVQQQHEPSAAEAFIHSAERATLPALTGLAAIAPGAEAGAASGAEFGPWGEIAGGIIGGIAAPFMASTATSSAQDYALSKLPDNWQDLLGQSEQQQSSEAEKQPAASFLGGLVPYALTMKPSFDLASKALPANATVYQKILANPVTSRVFSGAVTGGMQLGQELGQGQQPNWTNDALATGFGVIFDRPNRIGESLMDMGGRSFRAVVGAPANENIPVAPEPEAPTVAQAGDAKVMGPGITESVFMGSHEQAPEAAMTAQDAARTETAAIRPQAPDVGSVARKMEPELFGQYDALTAQRNDLRTRLTQIAEPSDEEISTASQQRDALQAELDALVEGKGGYTGGPDARRLRAQIRDAQSQVDAVTARRDQFAAGEGADTPEMAALRQQIMATDFQMRDLAPQVGAAYRRAADVAQTQTIEPEPRGVEVPAPVVGQPSVGTPETTAIETPPQVPVEAQAAAIAQDVTRQMLAAGRPQAEAEATGQLLGRHYVTRAGRLQGALGTPQGLYEAEGPIIRARDVASAEPALAQSKRDRASGYIDPIDGVRRLLTLTKNADASTAIHESGHQWLDELMRDAQHERATDALKDDAQTVRDWLKYDGDAPLKTRQHEKFARGFEQYMREGIAPSAGLARVFAQFKTWLTSIYQTIKGLGAPINEDIRGVFDRLIEQEPQRTVVAPENAAEPTLHDIHEADAAEANPHHAEPIGDRISAERDAYVAQQPPEVQNELAAAAAEQQAADVAAGTQPAGEGGAGQAAGGELGTPVGEPEAQPAGGTGGGERSAVVSGGGAGVPESNGAGGAVTGEPGARLRGNGPSAARAHGAHPLAPDPGNLFGAKQSPFLDLAGNIRVDNLTSDRDVAQAIHDAAQANNDFIGDRRGVVTDGQVLDLADALGMTPDDLAKRHIGQAFNAEQVVAARKLLIQSATDIKTIMQRVADNGTDEDVMAFARAKARHQMIQGQVAGITAEAGRALRAFRSLAGQADAMGVDKFIKDATGKTLFQLREEAKLGAQLDTPEKVSKFVRDGQKRTFGSMVLEYWINGLISGPATHATYSIGNTMLALQKVGPETAAAALIGRLRRRMGRPGETVRMGEVGAQLAGMASSLPMATKAAIDSLRTGVTTRLPGEDAKSLPFQPGTEFAPSVGIDEAMNYARIAPELFGMVRGIRDGLVANGKLVSSGGVPGAPFLGFRYSPLGAIPDIAVRGVPVVPLGTAARLPSRGVAAIHSFFRTVNYSMAKNALAYRSAAEAGLTGTAFDAHVANVRQNPSPEMMKSARGTATQLTLMGQGSEFVQALSRLTNAKILGFPLLKFVDPFVHIAGNVIDQSIVQRTPLGILSPELRADLMGKNGNIAQDTAMGRMLVGTGMSIAFGTLAAQGLVSGSGPDDRNQAAMWRLAGNQPHSIRIGDTWYSIGRLGPLGMLSGVAADMYDVAHAASQGDMLLAASQLQHAFTQNILDESFMSGPADLIQALEDPGRYGESYLRNFASGFVPYSTALQQMDRASDPYSRSARSIMDSIKNKIPGLSETLMPRRDIWGMPMPNPGVLGPRGLSAIYTTQVNSDPVNTALFNLGISPAQPERKIRGVDLTDQQYDTYQTLAGGMAKQRLNVIIGSRLFQSLPSQTQVDVINETISQSRETARNMVMARFPQIAVDATRAKLAPLKTP